MRRNFVPSKVFLFNLTFNIRNARYFCSRKFCKKSNFWSMSSKERLFCTPFGQNIFLIETLRKSRDPDHYYNIFFFFQDSFFHTENGCWKLLVRGGPNLPKSTLRFCPIGVKILIETPSKRHLNIEKRSKKIDVLIYWFL